MRERKDCENAHPPHLQLRRERRERREGERGRGVPVLSGAKEEERPKEGRSRSSAVRNKKKKNGEVEFFLFFDFDSNSTSALLPRPTFTLHPRATHGKCTHRSLLSLPPAGGAVGGGPRGDLCVDLCAGPLGPRDKRAGPGRAGGPPRDVKPGLVECRELSDLSSFCVREGEKRERRGR